MTASALRVDNAYAALSLANGVKRLPRVPGRERPAAFFDAFDAKTLFYDCFWHQDGQRILLVGPPPVNLGSVFRSARYIAKPSGARLTSRAHASLTVMITELRGAPADTTAIEVSIGGEQLQLAVGQNSCRDLAGSRLLFSINKDNDLAWIREWAEYHQRLHGTDAVILFDNASTRYEPAEILAVLQSVPGIVHAGVPSWPYRFGPIDPAVKANPYWARFLQISS